MKINIEVDLTVMELPKDKLAGVYYPNEGNTIIFSKGLNSLEFKEAFLHEIGHLFGAVHFFHTSSVMYPNVTKSLKFDQVNKALILKAFKKQPKKH